ncbi:MAG: Ig-like domain-containing protein, partial [Prevotella sp.]|nr:Ig-like domain-containing protein [Prevotella sp.]
MQYSKDGQSFSTTIPTGTNAGSYDVWYKVKGNTGYDDVAAVKLTASIAKAAGSISYATASVSRTYGDGAFTNTLTNTGDGTVSYSSSNTSVATVNSTSGKVTIKGNGTSTITATVKDGTNYTYATKTAKYTL